MTQHEESNAERLVLEITRKERHDLFNPLNQVIGYTELLIEEARDAGNSEAIPTLEKVNSAAQTLNRMLTEILQRAQAIPHE